MLEKIFACSGLQSVWPPAEGIHADEYLKLTGGQKDESATEAVPRDPDYLLADIHQVCHISV